MSAVKRKRDGEPVAAASLLNTEDFAFPRGGGSTVLTPLEIKQAANEASKELFDGGPKRKRTKQKKANDKADGKSIKIESLSFARVIPGSLVLGLIVEINRYDMVVSLANNLLGYVSITRISNKLTKLLENGVAESDSEDERDEESMDSAISLHALFQVGQWVRAVVVETDGDKKKHIDLTIDPKIVNEQIQDDDLIPGVSVQASVTSVEDHGVILDIGKDERSGFISKKELQFAEIDIELLKPGSVRLFTVLSTKRTVALSAYPLAKKIPLVSSLSDISSLLPGTVVDLLITEVRSNGVVGKVLGLLDAIVDLVQSGILDSSKIKDSFKEGTIVKARIIFSSPKEETVNVSLLPNVLGLKADNKPLSEYPPGQFVDCKVKHVESALGLFVDIGASYPGFIHISRVSDRRIEKLSNESKFKAGTIHKGRILGFSQVDGLYIISTEQKILDQKYLSIRDVTVGEIVNGLVERILPKGGVLVKLSEGLFGLANDNHLSDIKLVHPDKKFKPGMKVTARVLNVDLERSRIILTLKKTLVHSQESLITSFEAATIGLKSPGSIIAFKSRGVIVEFFGGVRGFLPVGEISEAYIKDPKDHFRLGQSVATRVLSVDPREKKLIVSCRTSSISEAETAQFSSMEVRSLVKATITEKTSNGVVVTVAPHGVRSVIPAGLLADGSGKSALKSLKVGDELDAVVLIKDEKRRILTLTTKESLLNDAKQGYLPKSIADFAVNQKVHGYVKNVTMAGLFVCFAGDFTALAPRLELSDSKIIEDPVSLFDIYQSVECTVISVDPLNSRVVLSLKKNRKANGSTGGKLVPGDLAEAVVSSIKETQLNVEIGKQQGRIDVSQLFDKIDEIKNPKQPLSAFSKDDKLAVRVVGYHDARHHQFLPISHRSASHIVLELSAKKSDLSGNYKALTLEDAKVGSKWLGFVNNITSNCLFINLTPTIRGRMSLLELSGDYSVLEHVSESYPIGSAIECIVIGIDTKSNLLHLSARQLAGTKTASFEDLYVGQTLPVLFIKSYPTNIVVSIGDAMVAGCHITDVSDEYSEDVASQLALQDVLQAKVVAIDVPNKRVNVALRPSLVSGSRYVIDKYIVSADDVKPNDVLRGFVKNVSANGLFISLGRSVTARVQIKELSDYFLNEWQKFFHVGQLVKGKVLSVFNGKIEFSLKESVVTGKSVTLADLVDLKQGDVLDGTIKRVEDYGVFVRLGDTNLSGLCHKSQVADVPLSDISKVFSEGDKVKVKVLSVNTEKRRIALGMKASYFVEDSDEEMSEGDSNEEIDLDGKDQMDMDSSKTSADESDNEATSDDSADHDGLSAGGFDWTANILDKMNDESGDEEEEIDGEDIGRGRKRRKRTRAVEDKTATLNTRLPQSVADYERLLIGSPNSSILWMNFMAFQLQLSEIEKAREIGKRALKAISFREESERLNIWVALLNLENSFGTDETLDETFKEAVQYADAKTICQKLVHIYIQSEKFEKAEELYKTIARKFGDDSRIWVSYATFMMDRDQAKARALLDRALSALSQKDHREVIIKFGLLEYSKGDIERGRTLFEGLISSYPRRIDLWIVYIDCEIKHKDYKTVEALFERVIGIKLSMKQAKFFFKKWLSFESKHGDSKSSDYVKAKASEYVASRSKDEDED